MLGKKRLAGNKIFAMLGGIASIIAIVSFLTDDTSERMETLEALARTKNDGSYRFTHQEQQIIENAQRQLWGQ